MKQLIILLLYFCTFTFLSENLYSQSGWFPLFSGTNSTLYSCSFPNINTGYVVDYSGEFLKTTNGGLNWSINTYIANGHLTSVYFLDINTGYICGDSSVSTGNLYFIIKTTNGGDSWSRLYQTSNTSFNSIYFYDLNFGYTTTWIGILRTSNGGVNWSQILINVYPVTSIFFPTSDTGYLTLGTVVLDVGYIYKSTNSGLNWSNVNTTSIPLNSVYFLNSSTGYAAGGDFHLYPLIINTTNGGINWQTQVSNQQYSDIYTDIVFTDSTTGYCSGYGILKTTNKGINWNYQISSNNIIYKLSMLNSTTGYAVGINGTILKTTTGGDPVGIKPMNNEIPKSFSLSQNFPNPFNPKTRIKFDVTSNVKREMSNVKLIVYDILGQEVATLINQQLKPGTYEIEWDGTNYPSGVYFYELTTENYSATKKLILLK
jgi:photosystem II stability/assembly factor-like uncharacterized protein